MDACWFAVAAWTPAWYDASDSAMFTFGPGTLVAQWSEG